MENVPPELQAHVAQLDKHLEHTDTIKKLKENDSKILGELDELKSGQEHIEDRLDEGALMFKDHKSEINHLRGDVNGLKEEVKEMKKAFGEMKTAFVNGVTEIKNEINNNEIRRLKDSMALKDKFLYGLIILIASAMLMTSWDKIFG